MLASTFPQKIPRYHKGCDSKSCEIGSTLPRCKGGVSSTLDGVAGFRLAEWLDGRLSQGDLSAAELARRSGLDDADVTKLRRGTHKGTSFDKLGQLARGLGLRSRAELVALVDSDPLPETYDPVARTVETILHDETLSLHEARFMLRLYLSYQPQSRARPIRERYGLEP